MKSIRYKLVKEFDGINPNIFPDKLISRNLDNYLLPRIIMTINDIILVWPTYLI